MISVGKEVKMFLMMQRTFTFHEKMNHKQIMKQKSVIKFYKKKKTKKGKKRKKQNMQTLYFSQEKFQEKGIFPFIVSWCIQVYVWK